MAQRIDGAIARIFRKIRNLRNELHKKTVNHLVQNYDVVIIPESNVTNKIDEKINSKVVWSMVTYYEFR